MISSILRSPSIARVIGVIDLRDGQAVHARGGRRDEYQPIGDAVDLARAYIHRHGLSEIYVADLDAIDVGRAYVERPFQGRGVGDPESGRGPDRLRQGCGESAEALRAKAERPALRTISGIASVWLDVGISSVERAREAIDIGAAHVVVGLETLTSFTALQQICDAVGGQRVAFSLDLRAGEPLGIGHGETAEALAARAARSGAGAIVVLDLARVGMRTGLDLDLLARVRAAAPDVELVAGGGVRDAQDLARLAEAGCDAALVGTALRDGSLATLKGSPHSH
jgi:phosphoribosylformimino-5-aminoimidazole carboxamide ribotide isomerase